MLVEIKLFGGLVCSNRSLPCNGLKKFHLELNEGTALEEIYRLLDLNPVTGLVGIVDGHAQPPAYLISESCTIGIFPPMADRRYDFFERI